MESILRGLKMNAVLSNGGKKIYGRVLQSGPGKIALIVTDKKGVNVIKRFNKSKWNIQYYEE